MRAVWTGAVAKRGEKSRVHQEGTRWGTSGGYQWCSGGAGIVLAADAEVLESRGAGTGAGEGSVQEAHNLLC